MQEKIRSLVYFLSGCKKNFLRDSYKLVMFSAFAYLLLFAPACDENNNGTNEIDDPFHGVFLGNHRDEALSDLRAILDVGFFQGPLHNIFIDGSKINELTQEEIQTIRDAFEQGFIILLYDMTDARIQFFYRDILEHPTLFTETEGLDLEIGETYDVFTIEQIDGIEWTSQSVSRIVEAAELGPFNLEDILESREFNVFTMIAFHMREWIEDREARIAELVEDGLIQARGFEELRGLIEAQTRQSTQEGTLLDLATAWIQTTQTHVGFTDVGDNVDSNSADATKINTYQMTSKAWLVTSSTPTGLSSFLLVNQDFNLASANGFLVDTSTQKYWYLGEYTSTNTLKVGKKNLAFEQAQLIQEEPETNQAVTTTETTSVTQSISGRLQADQGVGNIAATGTESWSTSNTFSKANVSINNLSLSNADLRNDASWQYLPRKAEAGPDDGCVNTLFNLADLSHETFSPTQAFIYEIDGEFAGDTLTIKTDVTTRLFNSFTGNCNIFGCACDARVISDISPDEAQTTFKQNVHIPATPEGPVGDTTCSDGIDNDGDDATDLDDSSCQ